MQNLEFLLFTKFDTCLYLSHMEPNYQIELVCYVVVNGDVHRLECSSSPSSEGHEMEEDQKLVCEILSEMNPPKVRSTEHLLLIRSYMKCGTYVFDRFEAAAPGGSKMCSRIFVPDLTL